MTTVDVLDPSTGELRKQELPLLGTSDEYTFSVEALGGIRGLLIRVETDGRSVCCAEVEAAPGERVPIRLSHRHGRLGISSGTRKVWSLPPSPVWQSRTVTTGPRDEVDLVLLVDSTMMLAFESGADDAVALLSSSQWKQEADGLASFAHAIAEAAGDLQIAIIAFGDHVMAPAETSSWLVHPTEPRARCLAGYQSNDVAASLSSLPASEGFDFVDGLAEALFDVRHVGWREHSRKLVLLFGDSPGYSMLDFGAVHRGPPPSSETDLTRLLALANSRIREHDVFEQAFALAVAGVEIATVFSNAGERSLTKSPAGEVLVAYARRQYHDLASFPEWAMSSGSWEPKPFASQWILETRRICAGTAPGVWLG